MELAVIGGQEFVLGFQLTGIRNVVQIGDQMENVQQDSNSVTNQFITLKENPEVAIIITDSKTMARVREHERYVFERSPKPLVLVLSETGGGLEDLRAMVRQAIGIDIMKESE